MLDTDGQVTAQNKNVTEANAKVIAAGWGTELIPFHAVLETQRQDDLDKRMNSGTDTCQNE